LHRGAPPSFDSDSVIKPLFVSDGDQESYFLDTTRDFVEKVKKNGGICEFNIVKGDHFSAIPEEVNLSIARFKKIEEYEAMRQNRTAK
jgi:hypothetical protein